MTLPKKLIIVEDEVITQRYLQDIVSQYDVEITGCFDNARDILVDIKSLECDMILMDINIKGPMDGIQLAREILRSVSVPIVFITAHNDDDTLEELLELAPYGFIAKPFSSKDVLVTLQVAYKRYLTHCAVHDSVEIMNYSDIQINKKYTYSKKNLELYINNDIVKFNHKQRLLISILVSHINHPVSYDVLIDKIWGDEPIADSALRTLVYSVRKILPDLPITSHSKIGYMLATE